jgi:hypothetical protein
MDLSKAKRSKNFEDRTGDPRDPELEWLLQQPSSRGRWSPQEKEWFKKKKWDMKDVLFNRYIQSNTEHMMTKGYYDRQPGEHVMRNYLDDLVWRRSAKKIGFPTPDNFPFPPKR